MTAVEAEQWLCARLEEAGGNAVEITRAEFAELLRCVPDLIEYKPIIPGAGAYSGYAATFSGAAIVLAK